MKSSVFAALGALGASIVFGHERLVAQPRTVVPEAFACACSIALDRIAVIGSPSDSLLLTDNSRFALAADGRIFASRSSTPGIVAVYSGQGKLQRTLGRPGRGPGEFETVSDLSFAADQLFVWDGSLKRFSVFNASLSFQRDFPFTESLRRLDNFLIIGNRIVISSLYQTPTRPGVVAIVRPDGMLERAISPVAASTPLSAMRRLIAKAANDRVWVASWNSYSVELWDVAGVLHQTFVRQAPWFRSWTEPGDPLKTIPAPQILGIRQGADGLLWIAIMVADEHWDPLTARTGNIEKIFDSIVEVLDPRTGRILASNRYGAPIQWVDSPEPTIASPRWNADAVVTWSLERPRVVRPTQLGG